MHGCGFISGLMVYGVDLNHLCNTQKNIRGCMDIRNWSGKWEKRELKNSNFWLGWIKKKVVMSQFLHLAHFFLNQSYQRFHSGFLHLITISPAIFSKFSTYCYPSIILSTIFFWIFLLSSNKIPSLKKIPNK